MDRKWVFGLLIAVAASGILFAGCELFSGGDSASKTYEPLTIRGKTLNGDDVEVVISTRRTPRVVLTPMTGDSYVLKLNGRETSRGTIVVDAAQDRMTFYPYNGEPFVGSYTIGNNVISLYEAPTEDGGVVVGVGPSTPPGGGTTRPASEAVARTPDEVILAFGSGNAIKDGNKVIVVGNVPITTNLTIEVPIEINRNVPVAFSIASGRVLTVKGSATTRSSSLITVTANTELEITGGGTLRIEDTTVTVAATSTVIVGAFSALEVAAGATLTLTNGAKLAIKNGGLVDVGDGTWTAPPTNNVTFETGGRMVVPSGANQNSLDSAITFLKGITNTSQAAELVVKLTPAFYTTSHTGYIKVDATSSQNIPFKIRGQGKNSTSKLKVGMWLANNSITLEELSFDIAVSADTTVPKINWLNGACYYGAVLISRSNSGNSVAYGSNLDGISDRVTVQNCSITIINNFNNYTAGILVDGQLSDTPSNVKGATNIVINNNIVTATGVSNNSPVQALYIQAWEPITVTNNTLVAKYASSGPVSDPNLTPSSAIFINRVYDGKTYGGNISNNDLSGGNKFAAAPYDHYSFYVNAYSTDASTILSTTGGNSAGVTDMVTKKFGTRESTWATATDNTSQIHKRLFIELSGNIKGRGFGAFCIPVYKSGSAVDSVLEFYNYNDGALNYISYWGYHITNGSYQNIRGSDADYKGGFRPSTTVINSRPYEGLGTATVPSYINKWQAITTTDPNPATTSS